MGGMEETEKGKQQMEQIQAAQIMAQGFV